MSTFTDAYDREGTQCFFLDGDRFIVKNEDEVWLHSLTTEDVQSLKTTREQICPWPGGRWASIALDADDVLHFYPEDQADAAASLPLNFHTSRGEGEDRYLTARASPDRRLLITTDGQLSLSCVDLACGRCLWHRGLPSEGLLHEEDALTEIYDWSHDGQRLLIGGPLYGQVTLIDARDGSTVLEIKPETRCSNASFIPGGEHFITYGKATRVHCGSTGEVVAQLIPRFEFMTPVAIYCFADGHHMIVNQSRDCLRFGRLHAIDDACSSKERQHSRPRRGV